jgi:hypothetical protein
MTLRQPSTIARSRAAFPPVTDSAIHASVAAHRPHTDRVQAATSAVGDLGRARHFPLVAVVREQRESGLRLSEVGDR